MAPAESSARRSRCLMVIVPDRLTDLVAKGELVPRYYNPGDLFDEVHLVLVNDDRPEPASIQPTVGRARLSLHNLQGSRWTLLLRTLGYRPWLLRRWARGAVNLAERVQPHLVRCHGAQLNAFAASEIERVLGTPYVVSLHINPDLDLRRPVRDARGFARRLLLRAEAAAARRALSHAAAVVCVYRFIVPYAEAALSKRIEVIYNVVGGPSLVTKMDYDLGSPPSIVVPGRQIPAKDPSPVLHAVAAIDGLHCTLIGRGELHEPLVDLARRLGIEARVTFIPSLPNHELVAALHRFDALVSVNDYGGVSKVELEAALVGMPVVTNSHPLEVEPEILGENCIVVDGSVESWTAALRGLLDDHAVRERIGSALRESVADLTAETSEARYAALYEVVLASTATS